MNMKLQLSNMESQFNLLLTQIQNMGLIPETNNQINNISFQFINFGIQMLRTGIQINNNIGIKEQINNAINNLNIISMSIPNNINIGMNMMPFQNINENIEQNISIEAYNVLFISSSGTKTLISCKVDKTVDELIKMFLIRIGRNDLFNKEDEEFYFMYSADQLNTIEKKVKKLNEFFRYNINPEVVYHTK